MTRLLKISLFVTTVLMAGCQVKLADTDGSSNQNGKGNSGNQQNLLDPTNTPFGGGIATFTPTPNGGGGGGNPTNTPVPAPTNTPNGGGGGNATNTPTPTNTPVPGPVSYRLRLAPLGSQLAVSDTVFNGTYTANLFKVQNGVETPYIPTQFTRFQFAIPGDMAFANTTGTTASGTAQILDFDPAVAGNNSFKIFYLRGNVAITAMQSPVPRTITATHVYGGTGPDFGFDALSISFVRPSGTVFPTSLVLESGNVSTMVAGGCYVFTLKALTGGAEIPLTSPLTAFLSQSPNISENKFYGTNNCSTNAQFPNPIDSVTIQAGFSSQIFSFQPLKLNPNQTSHPVTIVADPLSGLRTEKTLTLRASEPTFVQISGSNAKDPSADEVVSAGGTLTLYAEFRDAFKNLTTIQNAIDSGVPFPVPATVSITGIPGMVLSPANCATNIPNDQLTFDAQTPRVAFCFKSFVAGTYIATPNFGSLTRVVKKIIVNPYFASRLILTPEQPVTGYNSENDQQNNPGLPPVTVLANDCVGFKLELGDQYTPPNPTTWQGPPAFIALSDNAPGGKFFLGACAPENSQQEINSLTVPTGATGPIRFSYRNQVRNNSIQITAQHTNGTAFLNGNPNQPGLLSQTTFASIQVRGGTPALIRYVSSGTVPMSTQRGGPVTFFIEDVYGNRLPSPGITIQINTSAYDDENVPVSNQNRKIPSFFYPNDTPAGSISTTPVKSTIVLDAASDPNGPATEGSFFFRYPRAYDEFNVVLTSADVSGVAPSITFSLRSEAGPVTKLAYATAPPTVKSNECSLEYKVQGQDVNGNPTFISKTADTDVSLAITCSTLPGLSTDACNTASGSINAAYLATQFAKDGACNLPLPGSGNTPRTLTIPAGQYDAVYRVTGTKAEVFKVSATGGGLASATATTEIVPSGGTTAGFINPATPLGPQILSLPGKAGDCLGPVSLRGQDSAGNPSDISSTFELKARAQVNVGGDAPNVQFYNQAGCPTGSVITSLTVTGATSAPFYIRGTLVGSYFAEATTTAGRPLSPARVSVLLDPATPEFFEVRGATAIQPNYCYQYNVWSTDKFGNFSPPLDLTEFNAGKSAGYLITSSLSGLPVRWYAGQGCTGGVIESPVGSGAFGVNSASASLYFRTVGALSTAKNFTMSAAEDNNWVGDTVNPIHVTQLVRATAPIQPLPVNLAAGSASTEATAINGPPSLTLAAGTAKSTCGQYTISVGSQSGTVTTLTNPATVKLQATGSLRLYDNATCSGTGSVVLNNLVIPANGLAQRTFSADGTVIENDNISGTVRYNGIDIPADKPVSIRATGRCPVPYAANCNEYANGFGCPGCTTTTVGNPSVCNEGAPCLMELRYLAIHHAGMLLCSGYQFVLGIRYYCSTLGEVVVKSFTTYRDGGGCFSPESQVVGAGGLPRRADTIEVGDELWNPVQQKPMRVKHVVTGPEKLPLYEFKMADHVLKVTSEHPMQTSKGLKMAKLVDKTDQLMLPTGDFGAIQSIRRLPPKKGQVVYNFILDTDSDKPEDRMIVADGFVTGDWVLQKQLANEAEQKGKP